METNKILQGRIDQFDPIRKFGYIHSETGEMIFFHVSSIKGNTLQVGGCVTFIRIPSIRHLGMFEAVNITTAYLSEDDYFVVDRPYSHLHDGLKELLPNVIKSITCNDLSFIEKELTYKQPVGYTTCVSVNGQDDIIYAKRVGKTGFTKFVRNRKPELTCCITVILKKTNDYYTIITAYFGKKSELEPWDQRATPSSAKFWEEHALIFRSNKINPDTLTSICPWNTPTENNQ